MHAECDFDNKKGETYDFTLESGFVSLQNVSYACKTEGDRIQADTFMYFDGGEYTIETAGGTGSDEGFVSYSAANMEAYGLEADDFRYIKSGGSYKKVADDYNGNISSRYALKQSSKGVKAGEIDYDTDGDDEDDATITENTLYSILVQSGEFVFDCADDAVHCNGGNLYVNGGTLTIDTLDDGLTSDLLTEVKGGNVNVKSSYEGIEGAYVNISGGEIRVNSSDDGINAAGDDTSIKEYISVSGGSVTVYAEGDGLDSNGSILMTGGTVIVHGPTSGADGALDADSGIIVQGGTLYAAGSLGMVETPSTNSTQYVLSYAQSGAIAAGTALSIQNADGEEIFSVTAEKNCQSVIVSLPAFASGETYKIYADGSLLTSFTISGIITSVSTSGGVGGGDFRPGGVGGAGENRPDGGR
ncbi:MAG: carbohydrate-binding domain-containing protein [Clostridiales bacterium]|nr:carbohydrate-binding domain-containing protein [Clostridiales bacterium]